MVRKPTAAAPRREAYTLVELLVVLGIIAFLTGLLVVMWPGFASSTQSTSNADKVQAMLSTAKQKAIHDRVATGVRLIADPNDPTGNRVKQLIYIQQPDPYTPPITTAPNGTRVVGTLTAFDPGPPQNPLNRVTFQFVDFLGGLGANDGLVQPGDYLEINGGGSVHRIKTVFNATTLDLYDSIIVPGSTSVVSSTTNWRIIRAPRPVSGEEPVELTGDVIIDLALSPNVPIRTVPPGSGTGTPLTFREILFAPSGSVIGHGTQGNDKIILFVRDSSRQKVTDGEPVLIAVQIGTGFIGGYPVDVSSGDYYSNTRDPHASGL